MPGAATLRLLVLALDYEEPGLVAVVERILDDTAACEAVLGRTPWATPADAAGRPAALLEVAMAQERVVVVDAPAPARTRTLQMRGSRGGCRSAAPRGRATRPP